MKKDSKGFEDYLLRSKAAGFYCEIKDYSVQSLNLPISATKNYVGFGKIDNFYMYFIGLRNEELVFSSRITYAAVKDESNIVRMPFKVENREKILDCINRVYNDYLSKAGAKQAHVGTGLPEILATSKVVIPTENGYTRKGLDVVLPTPIEELVPRMISFNNDELMEKVDDFLRKYEGRQYDDTIIDIAKEDRKRLNALSRKLNNERLRIARIYKAPYERFKQQVDEIIDRIEQVSDQIDVQIKSYEREEQRTKREKIKSFFDSVFAEYAELISYETIHQDRWLKKSVKISDIYAEIKRIFIQIKSDIVRIESIESEDEDLIKNYYFRTLDIEKALAEAERHRKARQAIAELNAKKESIRKNTETQPMASIQPITGLTQSVVVPSRPLIESDQPKVAPSPSDEEERDGHQVVPQQEQSVGSTSVPNRGLLSVEVKVEGTEDQITALKKYLLSSGMKFKIIENSEVIERDDIAGNAENENSELKTKAINILRRLYGNNARFRTGQFEAIEAALTNKRTLIVQKTGWGKSMVYFTATRLLRDAGRGVTIVVSPLLSLMENQMEAAINLNMRCESFNSTLKKERRVAAIADLKADKYDMIFVTPETLFRDDVNSALQSTRIGLFVIDEAHCISDWGNDFRLDYSNLHKVIAGMPSDVPVLATTATANNRVIEDIKKQFGNDVFVSRGPLTRESLIIQVLKLNDRAARYAWIQKNINKLPGTGIIYCLTHSDCVRLSEFLVQNGIDAMPYYSGDDEVESMNTVALERFKNNQLKAIVATVKLGMGYDKGDIGFVIHYQMPPNIVSYYQQIGRAGRNIDKAYAILMCGEEDDDIHEYFMKEAFPTRDECYGILSLIEREGGASLYGIGRKINISNKRIEKTLGFLVHEEAIYRDGDKYYLSPKKFVYNEKHYEEITEQRKKEYEQMKELVELKTCYSKFIANCLDDMTARECGKCANCTGHDPISGELRIEERENASYYLDNYVLEITPLDKWESNYITGQSDIDKLNEPGVCLSKYNDPGYGALVKKGKYEDNEFDLRLVERSIEILKPIVTENAIKHICCVPSLRSDLVKNFTVKVAAGLGIEFIDCLIKSHAEPQKSMQNAEHQCKNAWDSFSVAECEIPQKMVLVDDIIDSKWTITVCGYKLMQKGAQLVFPFALADSSRR